MTDYSKVNRNGTQEDCYYQAFFIIQCCALQCGEPGLVVLQRVLSHLYVEYSAERA